MDDEFEGWLREDCFIEGTRLGNVLHYDEIEFVFRKFGMVI